MTDSFALRAPGYSDVPDITHMVDAATRRWTGRPTTEEQVRERLDTPGADLGQDGVVADAGQILGFGHLWPATGGEIRCFARTHPDHRGRGIGTALQQHLVDRARQRAAEDGSTVLTTTTWAGDPGSDDVLAGVGYAPERFFQKMVLRYADAAPPPVELPEGVRVRGYREGEDDDALFAAFVEAFAEHWGEQHPDETGWWCDRRDLASAGYDPTLWSLAMDGTDIVGFVLAKTLVDADGDEHGYIGDVGVRPNWRGRGLGLALLTHSLRGLHERGLPYTSLDVDTDNTTGALRTYERAGMIRQPAFTIWSRQLR